MVAKKKPMMYLDVTKPNADNNYYLINNKNKIIGEIPVAKYQKNPEDYLNDEITPMTYTGWRKKKFAKSKVNRKIKGCGCK